MQRSDHDPTGDERTRIVDDVHALDEPAHGEEGSPRTERMTEPEVERPRWNQTVPIAGGSALKDEVRRAGDALAERPTDGHATHAPSAPPPHRRRGGDTLVSPGQPRRMEPEPPTMRRPERPRRGPYLIGAVVCVLGGGVVAALWPSEGAAPPPATTPTVSAPTVEPTSAEPPAPAATPHAPPTPSLPLVEGAGTGDGSDLAPYQGYLVVRSPARAEIFEGQTSRGPTNRKLVLRCRDYTIRLRDVHTQRWLSAEQTVSVACQKITTVVVTPEPR